MKQAQNWNCGPNYCAFDYLARCNVNRIAFQLYSNTELLWSSTESIWKVHEMKLSYIVRPAQTLENAFHSIALFTEWSLTKVSTTDVVAMFFRHYNN